jgi:hypothetical protein
MLDYILKNFTAIYGLSVVVLFIYSAPKMIREYDKIKEGER